MATEQLRLASSDLKRCTKCGHGFPATLEYFNKHARTKYGLRSLCKGCQRAAYRNYFLRNYDKVRAAIRERDRALQPERSRRAKENRMRDPVAVRAADAVYRLRKHDKQARWQEQQAAERQRLAVQAKTEFWRHQEAKRQKAALDTRTKQQKQTDYQKKRRREMWEQVRALEKARQARRKDKAREYQRTYNRLNRERIAERSNKWQRNKRAINPTYRLCENMSSGIWQSLKNGKSGRKWEVLVGYTSRQLIAHLESQFQLGMTWGNYGKFGWHVDHIRPISSFSFISPEESAFLECWALSNLRPLWWDENIRKKDRILEKKGKAAG